MFDFHIPIIALKIHLMLPAAAAAAVFFFKKTTHNETSILKQVLLIILLHCILKNTHFTRLRIVFGQK